MGWPRAHLGLWPPAFPLQRASLPWEVQHSPGPDCPSSLGQPRAPLPSPLRLGSSSPGQGHKDSIVCQSRQGRGDALEGGMRAGTPTDGDPDKALFKRDHGCSTDNAPIQEPGYQRNQMPGAMNLAVPGGQLEVISGLWTSVNAAVPPLHRRSPPHRGCPSGPACVHTGTSEVTGTAGQVPALSRWDPCLELVAGLIFSWV